MLGGSVQMKRRIVFLFDLDSTVTTQEILPEISKKIDRETEMRDLTEKTMMGEIGFEESFRNRVKILSDIPVSSVADFISNIGLGEEVVNFIKQNKKNCYIVTSNLDAWIEKLMDKIGMQDNYFSSHAIVKDDKILGIEKILSKEDVIKNFDATIVAIGDGSNDHAMLKAADIAIAYGGVRNVAPSLLEVADYAIYDGKTLAEFLSRLV